MSTLRVSLPSTIACWPSHSRVSTGNRYARHLRVNGLREGSAVLDRFVGQVRAIGRNENVRVHNRTPLYAFESGSTVQGAIALAIDAAETGQAYWVTAALARDSVVGSLDVSFTADVFPQSSTIS